MNNTIYTHTLIYTKIHIPMSHYQFSSFGKKKRTVNEGHFTELTTFPGMSCVQHPKPKMSLTHNFIRSSKCPRITWRPAQVPVHQFNVTQQNVSEKSWFKVEAYQNANHNYKKPNKIFATGEEHIFLVQGGKNQSGYHKTKLNLLTLNISLGSQFVIGPR